MERDHVFKEPWDVPKKIIESYENNDIREYSPVDFTKFNLTKLTN